MKYAVRFIANGRIVTEYFVSAYACRKFVERAKRSKKIYLLSYPNNI